MANEPTTISHIQLNDGMDPHPIDAVSVGEKELKDLQQDGLVTSIDSNSRDDEYPSAKCVYDIIGDTDRVS